MADIGFVRAQLNGISDAATKRVLTNIFEHILGNLRIGVPDHQTRAENFQAYFLEGTTSTSIDQEFSIAHGLPATPHYAIQLLALDSSNAKVVRLQCARPADGKRIYLNSPETGAKVTLLVEA